MSSSDISAAGAVEIFQTCFLFCGSRSFKTLLGNVVNYWSLGNVPSLQAMNSYRETMLVHLFLNKVQDINPRSIVLATAILYLAKQDPHRSSGVLGARGLSELTGACGLGGPGLCRGCQAFFLSRYRRLKKRPDMLARCLSRGTRGEGAVLVQILNRISFRPSEACSSHGGGKTDEVWLAEIGARCRGATETDEDLLAKKRQYAATPDQNGN